MEQVWALFREIDFVLRSANDNVVAMLGRVRAEIFVRHERIKQHSFLFRVRLPSNLRRDSHELKDSPLSLRA
jgi:hypothetical protein